jgi:G3E family GTPase
MNNTNQPYSIDKVKSIQMALVETLTHAIPLIEERHTANSLQIANELRDQLAFAKHIVKNGIDRRQETEAKSWSDNVHRQKIQEKYYER